MNQKATRSPASKTQPPPMTRLEFTTRAFIAAGVLAMVFGMMFLLWWARAVFLLLFAGVVFGVFLQGASNWFSHFTRLSYSWSLSVVSVLLVAAIGLTGWLLGANIATQFAQLAQTLPKTIQQLQEQLLQYEWGRWLIDQAHNGGALPDGQNLLTHVGGIVGSVLSGLTAVLVIGFVGLYWASNPRYYRQGVLHLVPKANRGRGGEVLDAINDSLHHWLTTRLISMLIVGVLTTLGLWFLQVPMALALGLLAFFLEAIPFLGPVLAAIPGILVAWTDGGTQLAGQTLMFYVVLQTLESYILIPVLQKEAVYLSPLLSIIVIIFFGAIAGLLGAIVAAPLLVVLMILVKMLYVQDALGDHTIQDGE